MYEEHVSQELKALFSERPFQGKDPWEAKVMFVGLDANYPKTIHQDEDFMKILRIYHSAGDQYWERYKEHAPVGTMRANGGDNTPEFLQRPLFQKVPRRVLAYDEPQTDSPV